MTSPFDQFGLSTVSLGALNSYTELALHWNKRIQLTATRDADEFVTRHVVDSLELARDLPAGPHTMIDVGSGGGLPGVVLAIVRPDIEFLLIEPTQKKHAFLSAARRKLGLKNLRTAAVRDEALVQQPDFERFDLAVARAVWALDVWLERGKRLIRPGGTIFAMEGREQSVLPDGASRRDYELSGDRARAIVSMVVP